MLEFNTLRLWLNAWHFTNEILNLIFLQDDFLAYQLLNFDKNLIVCYFQFRWWIGAKRVACCYLKQWWLSLLTHTLTRQLLNVWHALMFITVMTEWAWWHFKSLACQLLLQPFVQGQIKENVKALHHWPLWGESTGDQWIFLTKGQKCMFPFDDIILLISYWCWLILCQ